MKHETRAGLLLLLTAVIWGFAMAAQREGSRYLSPMTFNAFRFTLGAAALWPMMLRENREQKAPLTLREALPGVGLGAILFIASLLQQMGVGASGAGKAGFLTALYVVLVPLLGLAFGRRTHPSAWMALGLALPALYLLCVPAGERFSLEPNDSALLIGAVFWALHILLTDRFVERVSALKLCAVQFTAGAVLNWILALLLEEISPENLLRAFVPAAYCGFLSTGLGYYLQTVGQKHCPPAVAALLLSLESVFCVIAGALLLGERMDARGYAGCALMLLAVALAQAGNMRKSRKEKNHV